MEEGEEMQKILKKIFPYIFTFFWVVVLFLGTYLLLRNAKY